jgi:hypothetical protein
LHRPFLPKRLSITDDETGDRSAPGFQRKRSQPPFSVRFRPESHELDVRPAVVDGGVVTTGVLLVAGVSVPRVVDVAGAGWLEGLLVTSAVMPTAAPAMIKTIRTTIQPLTLDRFSDSPFSSFM